MPATTRRGFMVGCSAAIAAFTGGLTYTAFGSPNDEPNHDILLVVFLRGGMDGLAAVPAYGDPHFSGQRGRLDPGTPKDGGVLDLDGTFGLHPRLTTLHGLYAKGELAVIHAASSPYRDRSHFSGQDVLENGTLTDRGARDGWLGVAWRRTAVLTITEFGRTVAANGSGGTDHGTGGASFLLGGASPPRHSIRSCFREAKLCAR